jgi:acetyltransferase-like isoleucine patch superfamily enzyme
MYTYKQLVLHLIAEIEAFRVKPGDNLYWRRKELHGFGVQFGKLVWVGRNFSLHRFGDIILGERCALGDNIQLINHKQIKIGRDFIGANNLMINSGTHDPTTLIPRGLPVEIGDRVWCGVNVTILAGVKIGNDVVIGAGSVVTSDIPDNMIAVGVPAKPIRKIDRTNLSLWSWR